jgi:predicted RNA-binding protein YlxR (DUF448 family)
MAMVEKYGFHTSEIAIRPFLSQSEVQADCQAELIPDVHRRPGRSYYLIPHYVVEDYYNSKKIPERIIREKMHKLKILPQAERQNLAEQILARKLASGQQLDLLSLLSSN